MFIFQQKKKNEERKNTYCISYHQQFKNMHQKLMTTMREKAAAFSCRDWPPFSRLVASQHLSVWIRIVIENQECEKEVNIRKKKWKSWGNMKKKVSKGNESDSGKEKRKKYLHCAKDSNLKDINRNIKLWWSIDEMATIEVSQASLYSLVLKLWKRYTSIAAMWSFSAGKAANCLV